MARRGWGAALGELDRANHGLRGLAGAEKYGGAGWKLQRNCRTAPTASRPSGKFEKALGRYHRETDTALAVAPWNSLADVT
jgi:hypothetical protein